MKENLYKHVEFLTTLSPTRNYQNKGSIDKTVNYITKQLQSYGYLVKRQEFYTEIANYTQCNLTVIYGDSTKRRLVVGAHYDVYRDTPGADDNASAVAGILETARLLKEESPDLDYCVEFVAYANEEPPFFGTEEMGSFIHAKNLHDNNIDVIGMICYEMIGYFTDEQNSQELPSEFKQITKNGIILKVLSKLPNIIIDKILNQLRIDSEIKSIIMKNKKYMSDIIDGLGLPTVGNFIIVMGQPHKATFNKTIWSKIKDSSDIDVRYVPLPKEVSLSEMSDHMNYWRFGYNAVMINDTSYIRNPHYHKSSDKIETLDFDKMTEVVKGVYNSVRRF